MASKVWTREEFVKEFSPKVNYIIKGTGLHAGTVLSQAIIESQGKMPDGNWRVGGSTLAREANNFFGIKCHGWGGKEYFIDTKEYKGGRYVTERACFRKYDSVEDSIADYVRFLQANKRYQNAGVFSARNVTEQAAALKSAGYATSPTYAQTITSVYNGIRPYISNKIEQVNQTKVGGLPLTTIGAVLLMAAGLLLLLHYTETKDDKA